MKKVMMLAAATLMLSSCATGIYLPGKSHFEMNTNVVLSQANYRIVRNLDVTVEINNTNLKRVDVEKSAYAELLRQANLTGSQALANVVVEEVRRVKMNIFRFNKHKQYVSAHASVIEFLQADGTPVKSVSVYAATPNQQEVKPSFENGDIKNSDVQPQPIEPMPNEDKYYLAYLKKTGKLNTSALPKEFNLKEIEKMATTHKTSELEKKMIGYNKKLETCSK